MYKKIITISGLVFCGLFFFTALNGCKIDSGKHVTRDVPLAVSGIYRGALTDGRLIHPISGAPVTSMNLRQTGDRLEAIDNNGRVFRGTIHYVDARAATFKLEGYTTQGVLGTISGKLEPGNSIRMVGTWIEPGLYGNVSGVADVGGPADSLTITPSTANLTTNNQTVTFSAAGGTGTYVWTVGNNQLGSITGTGSTVTYRRLAQGSNTVRVTSGAATATALVSQP